MKVVKKHYISIVFTILSILTVQQTAAAQDDLSPPDNKTVTEFEAKARAYSAFRERIENDLPKLPTEASAEQIEAHKVEFQKRVLEARAGAKQGEIFTPAASQLIRAIIKTQFSGTDGAELRKKVFEAETQGVTVAVNVDYPESKEQIDMPPNLLLALPRLPKQLRFRFVGNYLLLVDRENGLIIDFMPNALP